MPRFTFVLVALCLALSAPALHAANVSDLNGTWVCDPEATWQAMVKDFFKGVDPGAEQKEMFCRNLVGVHMVITDGTVEAALGKSTIALQESEDKDAIAGRMISADGQESTFVAKGDRMDARGGSMGIVMPIVFLRKK